MENIKEASKKYILAKSNKNSQNISEFNKSINNLMNILDENEVNILKKSVETQCVKNYHTMFVALTENAESLEIIGPEKLVPPEAESSPLSHTNLAIFEQTSHCQDLNVIRQYGCGENFRPRLKYYIESDQIYKPSYNENRKTLEIRLQHDLALNPKELKRVNLQIALTVPRHHYASISTDLKCNEGVLLHTGIILVNDLDSISIILQNVSEKVKEYFAGDIIAEICIHESKYHIENIQFSETDNIITSEIEEKSECLDFTALEYVIDGL